MNVTAVKSAFIAALRVSDSDLNEWCLSTYGRECMVFVGLDEDRAPCANECPCVEIATAGRVTGPAVNPREYLFSVILTLHDDEYVDHDDSMVTEHAGVDRLEVFTEYVRAIFCDVTRASDARAMVGEHVVENNPIESYPFFQSGSLFRVTDPQTIGNNPY